MMRLTTYLLLAAFLRLQLQCCHCAHDHAAQPTVDAAAHVAEHHHLGTPHHHERTTPPCDHHGPCDECNLCQLSHQSYLGAADLPALDPPAIVAVIEPESWVLNVSARIAVTHTIAPVGQSLVSCGSLLRI
jgi:hypothetical protein